VVLSDTASKLGFPEDFEYLIDMAGFIAMESRIGARYGGRSAAFFPFSL